jgi:hypothetical protein
VRCLCLGLGGGGGSGGGGGGLGVGHGQLGVLELDAFLALELGAADGELGGLVGRVAQLALGVRLGQGSAVLDQLEQTALFGHAGGAAAEGSQLPRLAGLNGGAAGGGEAQAGEICQHRQIKLDYCTQE